MASAASGVSFSAFLLSLATAAAVQFGDLADPSTGTKAEPNLAGASEMIELIAMIEEKTRGNLTPDETQLLERILYELRLRFVTAQQGERRIIEP